MYGLKIENLEQDLSSEASSFGEKYDLTAELRQDMNDTGKESHLDKKERRQHCKDRLFPSARRRGIENVSSCYNRSN